MRDILNVQQMKTELHLQGVSTGTQTNYCLTPHFSLITFILSIMFSKVLQVDVCIPLKQCLAFFCSS